MLQYIYSWQELEQCLELDPSFRYDDGHLLLTASSKEGHLDDKGIRLIDSMLRMLPSEISWLSRLPMPVVRDMALEDVFRMLADVFLKAVNNICLFYSNI